MRFVHLKLCTSYTWLTCCVDHRDLEITASWLLRPEILLPIEIPTSVSISIKCSADVAYLIVCYKFAPNSNFWTKMRENSNKKSWNPQVWYWKSCNSDNGEWKRHFKQASWLNFNLQDSSVVHFKHSLDLSVDVLISNSSSHSCCSHFSSTVNSSAFDVVHTRWLCYSSA